MIVDLRVLQRQNKYLASCKTAGVFHGAGKQPEATVGGRRAAVQRVDMATMIRCLKFSGDDRRYY